MGGRGQGGGMGELVGGVVDQERADRTNGLYRSSSGYGWGSGC